MLSGFYSKDAILVAMAQTHPGICVLGLFTAFLTAFYMTRLLVVVFLNPAATEEGRARARSSGGDVLAAA